MHENLEIQSWVGLSVIIQQRRKLKIQSLHNQRLHEANNIKGQRSPCFNKEEYFKFKQYITKVSMRLSHINHNLKNESSTLKARGPHVSTDHKEFH